MRFHRPRPRGDAVHEWPDARPFYGEVGGYTLDLNSLDTMDVPDKAQEEPILFDADDRPIYRLRRRAGFRPPTG